VYQARYAKLTRDQRADRGMRSRSSAEPVELHEGSDILCSDRRVLSVLEQRNYLCKCPTLANTKVLGAARGVCAVVIWMLVSRSEG
jgi:hypothetical protein